MATITLIRHGEVHADWHGRLYGSMDVPLSEEGQAQARAVARELSDERFAVIASSGLMRAEFTAQILRRNHAGLERLERLDIPGLRERDRGDWAGLSAAEIDVRKPGASAEWTSSRGIFTPPGGETVDQVHVRVVSELDQLAQSHEGQSICVVAHLWVLRAAVAAALGLPAQEVVRLDIPTSGRVRLQWSHADENAARGSLDLMLGTPRVLAEDRLAKTRG